METSTTELADKVFNGNPLTVAIIGLLGIIFIVLLAVFGKKGWLTFSSKSLKIGHYSDKERNIIRHQIEYAESVCLSFISDNEIKVAPEKDYKSKYIMERVFDEIIKWISFNHITNDKIYITCKQKIIWGIISKEISSSDYKNENFHKLVNETVEIIIDQLCEIRKYLSNDI